MRAVSGQMIGGHQPEVQPGASATLALRPRPRALLLLLLLLLLLPPRQVVAQRVVHPVALGGWSAGRGVDAGGEQAEGEELRCERRKEQNLTINAK